MSNGKNKVILLVEDEAIVAMSEARTLEKYDYEVIIANNGEDALKIVNSAQRIDLILMDINLGKAIDGSHAAEIILENRDIPLVFLSSHTEREVVEKTEGITSYGYIVKNSGETVLIASIKMAFRLFEARLKEKEKEEEYRLLFENASSGIFIAQDGKIKIFNPALIEITDYPADAILSRPFASFIHPDDVAMVVDRYNKRLAGETVMNNYPFRIIHANGDIIWVELTATRTSWKGKPATLNYIIDITERKLAEEELMLKSLVLDQIEDHVTITDLQGRIVYVNQAQANILKSPKQVLIGQSTKIYGEDPERGDTQQEILEKTLRDGFWRGEIVNLAADGSEHIMDLRTQVVRDEKGTIIALCGSATDITERKQIEEALRESKKRLQDAQKLAHIGVWDWIADTDTVTWTEELYHIAGRDPKRPAPKYAEHSSIYTPQSWQLLKTGVERAMKTGESYQFELELVRLDGSIRSVIAFGGARSESNGRISGLYGIVQDITERKRAEETLRESEMRYRNMFENAPVGVFYSTADGKIDRVNAEYARIMGFSSPDEAKQIINQSSVAASIYDQPIERAQLVNKAQITPGSWIRTEQNYRRKDGSHITANLTFRALPENPNLLEGFVEDINKQTQVEEELRNTQQRLDDIVSNLYAGVMFVSEEGRVELINQAYCDVFKLSETPAELRGLLSGDMIKKVIHAYASPTEVYARIQEIIAQGEPVRNQEFTMQDGRFSIVDYIPIIVDGKRRGRIWHHMDISKRKQTEDALRQSEERYRTIIKEMDEGYFEVDLAGNFTFANEAECRNLGYPREELIGMNTREYADEKNAEKLYRLFNEIYKTGIPVKAYDFELIKKDGSVFYHEISASLIRDSKGNPIGFRGVTRDITERKQADMELRSMQERLDSIISNLYAGVLLVSEDGKVEHVNQAFCDMHNISEPPADLKGLTSAKMIKKMAAAHASPEMISVRIREIIRQGKPVRSDEFSLQDGRFLMVDFIPLVKDGRGYGRIWHYKDITEQKLAEEKIKSLLEEKELLLKEVHHRIKNNMNTISSILSLQAGALTEPSAIRALNDAKNRVVSMAVLYDKLYRSENLREMSIKEYLPSLVDEIVANFPNSRSVKIEKKIDDFILDVKKLQPLGIIVNELLTNIMKYAFMGRSDGLITLSVALKDNRVSLIIQDNGNGMPESIDFEKSTGFGLKLVGMLIKQLKGSTQIRRQNGTKIILAFET